MNGKWRRAALSFVKCAAFFLGWAIAASLLPLPSPASPAVWRLWAELIPLLAVIAFTLLFWLLERGRVQLPLARAPGRGLLIGAAAGALWLAVPTLAMYAAGVIRPEGVNQIAQFPLWITAAVLNVIMQELLVRGYLYQLLRQAHGAAVAVAASTALFTLLHGGALAAGPVPVLNVLTMSLLMTAVLEYTGSLVAPTAMHAVWNGVGALVLGGVSLADDYPHLLNMAFSGEELLSGGACKIEGSVFVLLTNIALLLLFLSLGRRRARARQAPRQL